MELHFDFKLATFRFDKIVLEEFDKATVYGSSEELGGNGWFKVYGKDKILALIDNVLSKLNRQNQELNLLYSANTIFAVSSGYGDMEKLDYLLVHAGTEDKNDLMSLESLDSYMDSWMTKYHLLFD